MHDILQQFGLTEKEARVYHSALELGKATAHDLARAAGIVRSTTYTQIESLMKAGLMSTYDEGKKTYYVAEDPENLKRMLENERKEIASREEDLKKALPALTELYNTAGERPTVRMFKDREGLIAMREEILKMKSKKLYVAFSYDDLKRVIPDEAERNDFTSRRRKKNIETKAIFGTRSSITPDQYSPEEYKIVMEKDMPFEFDIYIFDNKVALSYMKGPIWGAILEGEIIAKSFLALFELAWKSIDEKK